MRSTTYRCFFVNGLDDKLLVVERDVADLTPRETDFRGQSDENNQLQLLANCAKLCNKRDKICCA